MIRTKAECKRRYDAAPGAEDFFTFPVFFAALCEKHALDRFSRDVLSKEARGALLSDADKLLSGYPLQYYLGEAEFFGQMFQISEGVLIPRADTEVLVREALACLPENGVLYDLCCGSGCIAISVLHKRPDAFAVAVDLSDRALECASVNALRFQVRDRLIFRKRDLLRESAAQKKADLICMNPPYIRTAVIETLPENVKREPRLALDGGADGLIFYRAILSRLSQILKEDGVALFEIGFDQGADLMRLADAYGCFASILPDLGGRDRAAKITLAKSRSI